MSGGAFRCGHAKSADNIRRDWKGNPVCRTCANAQSRASKRRERALLKVNAEEQRIGRMQYRMRYLPRQIEGARAKLAALENEARRYGMTELLEARQ